MRSLASDRFLLILEYTLSIVTIVQPRTGLSGLRSLLSDFRVFKGFRCWAQNLSSDSFYYEAPGHKAPEAKIDSGLDILRRGGNSC